MTALAANFQRPGRKLGSKHTIPVAASTRIYEGSLVMIDSNGNATPAVAAANNRGCVGVATKEANNTGSAGAISVEVQEGEFLFTASGTLTQASMSRPHFSEDDNTVHLAQAANEPQCGFVSQFVSATSAWVLVGLAVSK